MSNGLTIFQDMHFATPSLPFAIPRDSTDPELPVLTSSLSEAIVRIYTTSATSSKPPKITERASLGVSGAAAECPW